jgi:DNA transposition AAA+ family ATPase
MMTEQNKEQIAVALEQFLAEQNPPMSQAKFAKLAGLSEAYISNVLKRKYGQLSDGAWAAISRAIGLGEGSVMTENYKAIMAGLAMAKQEGKCVLIDGETGAGKSHIIDDFQRKAAVGTYVMVCSNGMNAQDFVQQLAALVGVDTVKGSQSATMRAIASKMLREAKPVLILDEMETMFKKGVEVFGLIKDLQRETVGRLGIVMVGAGLWKKLQMKASYEVDSFPQLLSRFKQTPPVLLGQGVSMDDAALVCSAYGISGRKDVRAVLEGCDNYRDLFGKLDVLSTQQQILGGDNAAA